MPEHGRSSESQDTIAFLPTHDAEAGFIERVEYDMTGRWGLALRPDFVEPVELRLGRDWRSSSVLLLHEVDGLELPADAILIQPDVYVTDRDSGWLPVGGVYPSSVGVGREVSPGFRFGPDVSRDHCAVWIDSDGRIHVNTYGLNGTRITVAREAIAVPPDAFFR